MECKILAGKTFRFIGFAPEQVCQLVELISKFGGTQMLSEQLVDFVVTPMNYEAEHVASEEQGELRICKLDELHSFFSFPFKFSATLGIVTFYVLMATRYVN